MLVIILAGFKVLQRIFVIEVLQVSLLLDSSQHPCVDRALIDNFLAPIMAKVWEWDRRHVLLEDCRYLILGSLDLVLTHVVSDLFDGRLEQESYWVHLVPDDMLNRARDDISLPVLKLLQPLDLSRAASIRLRKAAQV
jgi:hypothetical protein